MMKVTKTVRFDAAHVLTDHPGMCRNLHGHTYRVDVTVSAAPDAQQDMVIDFKDLKRVCEEEILARFDHAFICDDSSETEAEIAAVAERRGMRVAHLDARSTAENLARHFFDRLHGRLPGVTCVQVWETPDSVAAYGV